jgi:hypothetical protein
MLAHIYPSLLAFLPQNNRDISQMTKKCLPGMVCLENITIVIILVVMAIICWLIYTNMPRPAFAYDPIGAQPSMPMNPIGFADMAAFGPGSQNGWPINVSTRPMLGSGEFSDCGVLLPNSDGGDVLPLLGRQLSNRQKWQYYCISNQRNGVRLQLYVGGNGNGRRGQGNRNAMQDNGVDELNDGDRVTVQGKGLFRVQMYDNAAAYLPYL